MTTEPSSCGVRCEPPLPIHREMRVHLVLPPFWAPLSPPLGISVLKGYLQHHGVAVTTTDLNIAPELLTLANEYFGAVGKIVPDNKRSNFHMISYDVLSCHLMARLNSSKASPAMYKNLVKLVFAKNYYVAMDEAQFAALDAVVVRFFEVLASLVVADVEHHRPTVYGVSTYSTSLASSLFSLQLVRERFPNVKTVMGGGVFADQLHPASPNWQFFLAETERYLDTIIVGEGEELFLGMLRGELQNCRVHSLKTLGMKTLDLSTTVIPDFSDFQLGNYVQMASYATRSCPFQCSFCSETVQWGKFRAKAPEQILRELTEIHDRFGGRVFLFGDSLLNQVVSGLSEEMLRSGRGFFYDAYLRADPEVCDAGNAELWRRGGYYRARIGVESGSGHVLELMNKQVGPDQNARALRTLAGAGIKTTTYWVVGHPGETDDDFRETLRFLGENADHIYEADWHPFYFFPQGQVYSKKWSNVHGIEAMYPEEYLELLLAQVWVLKTKPEPEQVFERMNLFRATCESVGIPNPYSLMDIYNADLRWSRLHSNAVPALMDVMNTASTQRRRRALK